jgi:hypothetical protein
MKLLLEKIDKYLVIQEKNDAISLSLKSDGDIKDIIEIVRKSDNMEKTLSMFNDSVREQIKKLIEGGTLKNGFE